MVKLDALPAKSIIRGLRGSIDFYVDKGQPMARRWPRKPVSPQSADSQATVPHMKHLNDQFRNMGPCVRDLYKGPIGQGRWTWRDLVTKLYWGADIDANAFWRYTNYLTKPSSYPLEKVADLPNPDPLGVMWTCTGIERLAGGTGSMIAFYTDVPTTCHMLWNTNPPTLSQVWKVERGKDVFCGYSWAWPPGTIHKHEHPLQSGGVRHAFWATNFPGKTLWYVQLVGTIYQRPGKPGFFRPRSYGPVLLLYHPFIALAWPNLCYASPATVADMRGYRNVPAGVPLVPPPWYTCGDEGIIW